MSIQHPHTKIITATAREILRPLGIAQRGRSRTWFDDNGWWVGLIEFQPSSWSRGSYLNVGVQWLWDTAWDSLAAFMYSSDAHARVTVPGAGDYIEYENDEQFAPLAEEMVRAAAGRALDYRALFPTVEAAARVLAQGEDVSSDMDAGIALGILGDGKAASRRFEHYLDWEESQEYRPEWQLARAERVRALLALVEDAHEFRSRIAANVREVREAVKLDPEIDLPF